MKKYYISTLLFGLLSLSLFSQDFNSAKLDSLFDTLDAKERFMGSIALSHNGENIYARAIGYSDVEADKKSHSRYQIQGRFDYQNVHFGPYFQGRGRG